MNKPTSRPGKGRLVVHMENIKEQGEKEP